MAAFGGDALLKSLRAIAIFEAAKGLLVLLAGFGLLSLIHRDLETMAESLVRHLHLNAASRYPHIFIDLASRTTDTRLWMYALAAAAYSILRLLEAYGLWKERRWAEWLAVLSAGFYLPFEVRHLLHRPTWLVFAAFAANLAIIAVMIHSLRHPRHAHHGEPPIREV